MSNKTETLDTIVKVMKKGEEYLLEVQNHSEDMYKLQGNKITEFKEVVNSKYNTTVMDMNNKIDDMKNKLFIYGAGCNKDVLKNAEAFINKYTGLDIETARIFKSITGEYPLSQKLNGISGVNLPLYNRVKIKIPKENCIGYYNFKSSIKGYDFKTDQFIEPIGYGIISDRDGIVKSKDGLLYIQKIKNEGVWCGIGTKNFMNHRDRYIVSTYDSNEAVSIINTGIDTNGYRTHIIKCNSGVYLIGRVVPTIIKSSLISLRLDALYNADVLPIASGLTVASSGNVDTYMTKNNKNTYIFDSNYMTTDYLNTGFYNYILFKNKYSRNGKYDIDVRINNLQMEENEISTPYVTDTREHSKMELREIVPASTVIIKCQRIKPTTEYFLLYSDKSIIIEGSKYIKHYFDRDVDNVMIINLKKKKLYINGIELERGKYWRIVGNYIGVNIDEKSGNSMLTRIIPIEQINPNNNKFLGVNIDEKSGNSTLIRIGE